MASNVYKNPNKTKLTAPNKDKTQQLIASFNITIKFLRFLGSCPITIKPIRDACNTNGILKYEYSFKFLSLPVLYTVILQLLYTVFIWYIIIVQIVQGKFNEYFERSKGHEKIIPTDAGWVVSCFVFIYFIWLWVNPFLLAIRCDYIAEFLDNISIFCQRFSDTFNGRKVNFDVAGASIRSYFFWNFVILLTLVMGVSYIYFPCLFWLINSHRCYHTELSNPLMSLTGMLVGTINNLHEDTMLISLFRITENLLLEGKIEIKRYSANCLVDTQNIQDWVKIGRVFKRQADVLKHIIGPHELAALLMNFLTWVILTFMIVNADTFTTTVLGPLTVFCVSNLVRLHIKTVSVTRITAVETRIRDLFLEMKMESYSSYAECERAFLIDVMACRPIRFTLCNIIPLDARLTTWLIGGVVTYLMVLLQLQDLMNSDKK